MASAQNAGVPGNRGDRPSQRGGASGPGSRGSGIGMQAAPVAKDDAEKKILAVLDDMSQNRGIGVPRDDGRLLRVLVESIGAKHVVELGTFRGYSGTWMCMGLRKTGGKLTTFEIDKQNAETSMANFKRAGVDSLVKLIEGDAHEKVLDLKDPIDLVFIDADKEGYGDYLKKLLPLVRPGGLVVAHNMNTGQADASFVKDITTNGSLETVFLNAGSGQISVSMKKR